MAVSLREGLGRRDVVILTLDALRYDVAASALAAGQTPHLAALLGPEGWERRHSPATFTLPAHEALFAGFFPTPADHPTARRPVALRFPGSRTTGPDTLVFDAPCLVRGYRAAGYRAVCVGGTSFFDPRLPAAQGLTGRFDEVLFHPAMGVTGRRSPRLQLDAAAAALGATAGRALIFINVSATHPPTAPFLPGADGESVATQAAALAAVDAALPVLLDAARARGGASFVLGGDHGTCFGDDGRWGHRHPHPKVFEVPWAERELDP